MLFDSLSYFLFLTAVFILNFLLPDRFRWMLLLLASAAFYLIGGIETFFVPLAIIILTFVCGRLIEKASAPQKKKLFYLTGLLINLGLLIFYKYVNFFIGNFFNGFVMLQNLFGGEPTLNESSLALKLMIPLGISYITFQAIGYLIEIYRGNFVSESNPGIFATYILFFPKLLSGPIERAHNFLPQLHQGHKFEYQNVIEGLKRILWGLFLKLVVANRLALYTTPVLGNFEDHSGITLLVASVLYTFQLFADFSGYTDIAIGSARLFGYRLMENFERPFLTKSVTEFWRKWHISLTTWVTDYIYNPMVIKYRSLNKMAIVLAGLVTFLILGFWHGANWTFIIFGLLQGIALSAEFLTRKFRKNIRNKIPVWLNSIIGIIFAFGYFSFSLVFFKAANTTDAFSIIGKVFAQNGSLYLDLTNLVFSALGLFILIFKDVKDEYFPGRLQFFHNNKLWVRYSSYLIVIFMILLLGVFEGSRFIYLQF